MKPEMYAGIDAFIYPLIQAGTAANCRAYICVYEVGNISRETGVSVASTEARSNRGDFQESLEMRRLRSQKCKQEYSRL
jgi:hypothetical protein